MPTFLSDPSRNFYLILAICVLVSGAVAYLRRTRKPMIVFLVIGLVTLAVVLCDYFVESPREQGVRRVKDMATTATRVERDAFLANLSESFQYKGAGRDAIRRSGFWEQIRRFNARIAVWGFDQADTEYRPGEVEFGFYGKGEAQGEFKGTVIYYIRTTFVRDPDGEYRLKTMAFFDVAGINGRTPATIPGFP